MDRLSSAMDWWDDWKLRVLVLCSLFVQSFLFFSAFVRRFYRLRYLRVVVWMAYMGGDALAIYALATLFNRQKEHQAAGGGVDALEVIWAPVLLIHLGGQMSICAYSLEDNELWKRHTVTLVSQVTVALYVFCKWWSGERRLLEAAVLLFIVGILRFGEKPWALRKASFRTPVASIPLQPRIRDIKFYFTRAATLRFGDWDWEGVVSVGHSSSLKEYVKEAQKHVREAAIPEDQRGHEYLKIQTIAAAYVNRTFLDLSVPYAARLHLLQSFLKLGDQPAVKLVREAIEWQFTGMYTKLRSSGTYFMLGLLMYLVPSLALTSVVLFAKSAKDGYDRSDITVTYILFSATFVMELVPLLASSIYLSCTFTPVSQLRHWAWPACRRWQDMVSQHNILSFYAQKKQPTILMKLATRCCYCLRGYINKHWYIRHVPEAQQILVLVRRHAEYGWNKCIRQQPAPAPATDYTRFNDLRGELALRKHPRLLEQLRWTFDLPFDECILLWHLATDLCLRGGVAYCTNNTNRRNSETISNHMICLLFICPEMLMLGAAGEDLFMLACAEIDKLMMVLQYQPSSSSSSSSSSPSISERSRMAQRILGMEPSNDLVENAAPMICRAQRLAKALIGHRFADDYVTDDDKRWELIQGVWMEMLCYSASRSRGYEHAKSLANGAEFLTSVWLLWSFMGMEAVQDRVHNPGPPADLFVSDEE